MVSGDPAEVEVYVPDALHVADELPSGVVQDTGLRRDDDVVGHGLTLPRRRVVGAGGHGIGRLERHPGRGGLGGRGGRGHRLDRAGRALASEAAYAALTKVAGPEKVLAALGARSNPMTRSSTAGCIAPSFASAAVRTPPQDSSPSVTRTIMRCPDPALKSPTAASREPTIGVAPLALTVPTLVCRLALSTPESGTKSFVSSHAPGASVSTVEP